MSDKPFHISPLAELKRQDRHHAARQSHRWLPHHLSPIANLLHRARQAGRHRRLPAQRNDDLYKSIVGAVAQYRAALLPDTDEPLSQTVSRARPR